MIDVIQIVAEKVNVGFTLGERRRLIQELKYEYFITMGDYSGKYHEATVSY